MRALVWHGKSDVRCDTVPDPTIEDAGDMIVGDRVVVPFTIACGSCFFCEKELYSCCATTNRDRENAEKAMGHAPAGLFGYSYLTGHYPGGQAEYLRVPTPTSAR